MLKDILFQQQARENSQGIWTFPVAVFLVLHTFNSHNQKRQRKIPLCQVFIIHLPHFSMYYQKCTLVILC